MKAIDKKIWKAKSRCTNYEWESKLGAYWEVDYDPISDDYTPEEISADELFGLWVRKVSETYSDGLIPVLWYVTGYDKRIFEFMPFQFNEFDTNRYSDFLDYFTWPINKETGDRLNWLALPVVDKLWNSNRGDKGGFIQEVTHWKPGILQPYVYLGSLLQSK